MREWVERTVERILALRPRPACWRSAAAPACCCSASRPRRERYRGDRFLARRGIASGWRRTRPAAWPSCRRSTRRRRADDLDGIAPGRVRPRRPQLGGRSTSRTWTTWRGCSQGRCGRWRRRRRDLHRRRAQPAAAGGFRRLGRAGSRPPDLSAEELRRRVRRRMVDEEELVVDPAFFFALARRLPAVRRVSVLLKRGRWHNELTRFRYDVILHTGETETVPLPLVGRRAASALGDVERLLGPQALAIGGLVNARVADEGIDPEDLWELAERRGYDAELSVDPDAPGRFRALLKRQGSAERFHASAAPAVPDLPWSAFSPMTPCGTGWPSAWDRSCGEPLRTSCRTTWCRRPSWCSTPCRSPPTARWTGRRCPIRSRRAPSPPRRRARRPSRPWPPCGRTFWGSKRWA